ncbi:arylamine N-acetyltransferase family protein [Actinocatenispora rupis]|nr:arylamine N-acetyltransferase [Actinocatenispora rupis]
MIDVTGYLERIGYRGPVRPDTDTLVALHRAHLATVPYENIDIQLGRPVSLDPAALADKIVRRRRGGFCFELNGAFGLLLSQLGFTVRYVRSAVNVERDGPAAWGNHLALLVATGPDDWMLADVGFGDGFLAPLPLAIGTYPQGPLTYQVRRDLSGTWRMVHHPTGTAPGYEFRTDPLALNDFADRCAELATAPSSSYVQTLVVQQPHHDHSMSLRARSLVRRSPDAIETRTLADRDELAAALADFGVPVDALGGDAVDALWRRADEQHRAWLSARGRI